MTYTKDIIITAEWIREYANSIQSPLIIRNGRLIAPSTMPILFWQSFELPIFLEKMPILHGSQQFQYTKPIVEGMVLRCELSLTSKVQKLGQLGCMTFLTYLLTCQEKGDTIVEATSVLIQVGEHV